MAVELCSQTLQVLEWGLQLWMNVPKESRGVIFERGFIRTIRRLKLEARMKVRSVYLV